ncbi:hypothetical protein HanXRQr2_Chr11g0507831 [Helianthus annuus]|uniref:Uncharacterized protein n=2 Tax=Helianthus annuus TaxID=4232 RepID=A0A9K3HRJ8_HELAN|nr:hypothetical protein HanXRQr2_Chr11g0507831 [Helianthus annuus]KAJ0502749.1 hypothetical protein HanHA300_Chr11g0416461 [Helianthus annuus]KAJ0510932.1 hypothetical protein HanIR_Chr11g0546251 [Helianthus annuus]KAJ0518710.1 hypothetical protein HanHA89_Chr11g0440501 [Helianthus annuus]
MGWAGWTRNMRLPQSCKTKKFIKAFGREESWLVTLVRGSLILLMQCFRDCWILQNSIEVLYHFSIFINMNPLYRVRTEQKQVLPRLGKGY